VQDVNKTLIDTDGAAQALRRFAEERDWQQFHSPKNLAMALSPDGQVKFPHPWPPQIPPGRTVGL